MTNTARSVYDYETFERVKAVFVSSWHVLQETLDLNSVFLPTAELPSMVMPSHGTREEISSTHLENKAENNAQLSAKTHNFSNIAADDLKCTLNVEEIGVQKSSVKEATKCKDTKTTQAQCHNEIIFEGNVSEATSMGAANSLSSSYNTKCVSRNDGIRTTIIS